MKAHFNLHKNSRSDKRALVTGATGFLGSKLVKYLIASGWNVDVIVRASSNLERIKFEGYELVYYVYDGTPDSLIKALKNSDPNIVFHLASCFLTEHESDDIEKLVTSNILFSTHLLDSMCKCGIKKLVNTGTSWQHFENKKYNPANLYAATKQAFESIISFYISAFKMQIITLYLYDTYGPGDYRKKIVNLLVNASINGKTLHMSPGKQFIDLVFVDDVINAIALILNSFKGTKGFHRRYKVSSDTPISVKDLVLLFQKVSNSRLKIKFGSLNYRQREVMYPSSCFKSVPKWKANTSLEEGLKITLKLGHSK